MNTKKLIAFRDAVIARAKPKAGVAKVPFPDVRGSFKKISSSRSEKKPPKSKP